MLTHKVRFFTGDDDRATYQGSLRLDGFSLRCAKDPRAQLRAGHVLIIVVNTRRNTEPKEELKAETHLPADIF